MEGKGTHTFSIAGPTKAEIPPVSGEEVLHGDAEHGVVVLRTIGWKPVENSVGTTGLVLHVARPELAGGDLCFEEGLRNASLDTSALVLAGNNLASLDDFDGLDS